MKFVLRQQSYSNPPRITPAPEPPYERQLKRPLGRPLGRGRDYRCDVASTPTFRATTRREPPPEPEELKLEMHPLARAANRLMPRPVPEETKPEMPPLAPVIARVAAPPEPEAIKPEVQQFASAAARLAPPPDTEKIKPELQQLAGATTRLVPPPEPEEITMETRRRGLLGGLFSWLRGGATTRKQLRLVETVPLGEKRFVAIIHAHGRKYLVGGGASGVALLTSLDGPASQQEFIAPLAVPVEVAG